MAHGLQFAHSCSRSQICPHHPPAYRSLAPHPQKENSAFLSVTFKFPLLWPTASFSSLTSSTSHHTQRFYFSSGNWNHTRRPKLPCIISDLPCLLPRMISPAPVLSNKLPSKTCSVSAVCSFPCSSSQCVIAAPLFHFCTIIASRSIV